MLSERKYSIGYYLLILIFLAACNQGNKGIRTTITGSFPLLKGKMVSISEFDINNAIPVDTTRIRENGSFKFTFRHQGPGFFLIKVDNKNFLTLILNDEKRIEVTSDQQNIRKSYFVKGSPDSELYRDFEMFLEVNRTKVDSLSKTYEMFQRSSSFNSVKLDLDRTYQEIFSNQRQYSIQFIKNHCGSLACLLVLNRRFGERKILNEVDDFDYFLMVDSCLSANYQGNNHLLDFQNRIQAFKDKRKIFEMTEKQLAPGNKVPEFGLQDKDGSTIQLSSLKGKPVVLYFWASWDPQSRKANLDLKNLIDRQGKNRPAVYAVGLESYKEPWLEAIKADGLKDWIHVTDLLNIHSSAKTLFNIPDNLPYFFFIDKEQIIRYKGSDFDELAKILQQ